jgi:hypothetical protein
MGEPTLFAPQVPRWRLVTAKRWWKLRTDIMVTEKKKDNKRVHLVCHRSVLYLIVKNSHALVPGRCINFIHLIT